MTWWKHALNRTQDFVADPTTKKFSKAGAKILEVASHLGQARLNGPLGIAGAVVGVLNVLSNETDQSLWRICAELDANPELRSIETSGIISLLFDQGFFGEAEVVKKTEDGSLVAITLNGQRILAIVDKDGKPDRWRGAYVSRDFKVGHVSGALWAGLGDFVTLTQKSDPIFGQPQLTAVQVLGYSRQPYLGPNDPKDFIQKFREYHAAKISKAFLLVGPPGCGKTQFSFNCAQELGGRLMVVTPDLLEGRGVPHQDIIDIVAAFHPSVLLFEDVDRVKDDRLLLSLLEFIRKANCETLVMSTANDPTQIVGALKRPGRLGPRKTFVAPDLVLRLDLIKLYAQQVGVTRDLSFLATAMEHPLFTHDYIREVCEQSLVETDADLLAYVERVKVDLGEVEKPKTKGLAVEAVSPEVVG